MKEAFEKVLKTIRSCNNSKQLDNVSKMIKYFSLSFRLFAGILIYEHVLRMEYFLKKKTFINKY